MSLILDGTNGLSDVDGTAATPAIRGTDANTGIFFGTDIIGFSEGGTEAMRINASGNLQTIGTIGVGNATPSTSGAGITFPATQSASSDANTLDDYEEGTWTPSWQATSTNPTQSGNTTCGYVKVGRLVTVYGDFYCTSLSGGSGNLQLSGLPFTIANTSTQVSGFSLGLTIGWTTTAAPRVAYTQPNSTYIRFYGPDSSDARNNYVTISTVAGSGLAAYSEIYFNFSYLASA